MNEARPFIADIQTRELLYFDEQLKDECYEFCKNRDIDCLPSFDNSSKFYQRNDEKNSFDLLDIGDDRRIEGSTFIFRSDLLDRFKKHQLFFVFTHGELTGVIHYSDYNRIIVNTYLFAEISLYERSLRKLLIAKRMGNNDMLAYFEHRADKSKTKQNVAEDFKRKIQEFEKKKDYCSRLEEFQCFYLMDLIGLTNWQEVIPLNDSINNLRNSITHSRNTIEMRDARTPDFIYEFDTFEELFKSVQLLLNEGLRIRNRVLLLEGLKANSTT